MTPKEYLKGKKVLVMGLGLFGGGESSAKWLLKQGAEVTVTDLKTVKELEPTLAKFTSNEREKIHFVLGRHRKSDFKNADIVVVNPGVPRESEYLQIAKKSGAKFENVASLFFRFLENPSIGITGTRGKSTAASFASQLLSKKYKDVLPLGSSETLLFREFEKMQKNQDVPAVVELSSWQLELLPESEKAPHIAIITNLYRDHLNRYKNITEYAKAKSNIFKYQTEGDVLILNDENEWTPFFQKQKPKAKVYYFSTKPLAKKKEGVFLSRAGSLRLRLHGKEEKLFSILEFEEKHGKHNFENFLSAFLAVRLFDEALSITKKDVMSLRPVSFRQESIYKHQKIEVINDTAATSPDATVAALWRFARGKETLLIVGGTDKDLDYTELAREIKKTIIKKNLFLLEGSGTKKLIRELQKISFLGSDPKVLSSLEECVSASARRVNEKKKGIILFSPAGASFEKFTNEIHRGEEFNRLVKKAFPKK